MFCHLSKVLERFVHERKGLGNLQRIDALVGPRHDVLRQLFDALLLLGLQMVRDVSARYFKTSSLTIIPVCRDHFVDVIAYLTQESGLLGLIPWYWQSRIPQCQQYVVEHCEAHPGRADFDDQLAVGAKEPHTSLVEDEIVKD